MSYRFPPTIVIANTTMMPNHHARVQHDVYQRVASIVTYAPIDPSLFLPSSYASSMMNITVPQRARISAPTMVGSARVNRSTIARRARMNRQIANDRAIAPFNQAARDRLGRRSFKKRARDVRQRDAKIQRDANQRIDDLNANIQRTANEKRNAEFRKRREKMANKEFNLLSGSRE